MSYELPHESLQRIWCRKSSSECCSGFTFSNSIQSMDGGRLRVTQGSGSFSVAMFQPIHGEGIYWCGVLSKNGTIIKLTERYFYITRRHMLMKPAESYDDICVARPLPDPPSGEPLYELE
ncbi:uncharacterized protein LOC141790370 [Halichoeres trimaculatus]|uniref:uncharacterized protein LOC141790370 n=1 Tax=Halichoeres trimaculatus TaxID=147232 RepID=UPI003D9ED8D5